MNRLFGLKLLIGLVLAYSSQFSVRAENTELLSEGGQKLLASYTATLDSLRAEIKAALPKVDSVKKDSYYSLHAKVGKLPKLPNPQELKMAPVTFAPGNPAYVEAQRNALIAAREVMKDAEVFLKGKEMHAKLAKCALLHTAAREMAVYASQGDEEKSHIEMLLNDEQLIIDVMELGGAYQNKYGQAIRNYKAVQKVSRNAVENDFYRLWALASSLEHPDGNYVREGEAMPDAFVNFYKNYEEASLKGELDPAFLGLSGWNCRFIFPFRSLDSMVWMRKVIRNYRPDLMRIGYQWRYCRITRTDIPYVMGVSRPVRPEMKLTRIQDYFLEGGICGPRAFTGRAATHAFGIPSRPAPQRGHAAISHWTPDGWVTVFGAHWTYNYFRGQCGLDFQLESSARMKTELYRQVHRANWIGDVYGEGIVARMQFGVGGGFWKSLAHYIKLAIVEDEKVKELESVGAEFAESTEAAESPNSDWSEEDGSPEQKKEVYPQVELTDADKTITTDANGVITIPVAACSKPESSKKVRFMKSFDEKFVQLHYALIGERPELRTYKLKLPKGGKYEFTANVTTVTVDRNFTMRVNRRNMYNIAIPYTSAEWMDTKPVVMELKEGSNKLQLTMKHPNKGLSIRSFTLKPVK